MTQHPGYTHVVINVIDRAGSGDLNVNPPGGGGGWRWIGIDDIGLFDLDDLDGISASDILLTNGGFYPWQDPDFPGTGTSITGWTVDAGDPVNGFETGDAWSMTVSGIGGDQNPFPEGGFGMATRGNEPVTGRIWQTTTVQATGVGAGLRWYYCGWDGKHSRSGPGCDAGTGAGSEFNWFELRSGGIAGPMITTVGANGQIFPELSGDNVKQMEINFADAGLNLGEPFTFVAVDGDSGCNRSWLAFDYVRQVSDTTATGSDCNNPPIPFDSDGDCIFNLPNFVEGVVMEWLDCGLRDPSFCL